MNWKNLLSTALACVALAVAAGGASADGWFADDVEADWTAGPAGTGTPTLYDHARAPETIATNEGYAHLVTWEEFTASGTATASLSREFVKTGNPGNLGVTVTTMARAYASAECFSMGGPNKGQAEVTVTPAAPLAGGCVTAAALASTSGGSDWDPDEPEDGEATATLTASDTLSVSVAMETSCTVPALGNGMGDADGGTRSWQ